MEVTYKWAPGSRVNADPAAAATVFDGLVKRDGALLPESVVEASRPDDAPLNGCFEWDDGRAAHEHRLGQARTVIGSFVVVYRQTEASSERATRGFVALSELRTEATDGRKGYIPIERVIGDDDSRRAYLASILREIESFQRRYAEVEEIADLIGPLSVTADKLRERVRRSAKSDSVAVPVAA